MQILILKIGGGQSEIFTVSRRVDPTGREVPPHESKICPPIPLSCLLKLGRGELADQGLGGPQQRAGRQVKMKKEGRNWGELLGIQEDPWGETGRARKTAMRREDLWKERGGVRTAMRDQIREEGGGPNSGF